MPTPHIRAERGEIAPRVIMPGDPRRAERIATDYLEDAELVTDVRGVLGFTGTWEGRPVTAMASGMGGPSITIYATELAREYGVEQIVRVGTAGGMSTDVVVRDVIIATGAHTDSGMTASRIPGVHFSHLADFGLARAAIEAAERLEGDAAVHAGAVFTSDHFYLERPELSAALTAHGTLAVEMEAAALYAVGAAERIRTLAVVTVSDHLVTGESMTAEERETQFDAAARIALSL
ncbi:purine-nucleoside phosphorylase [Demequina mangrovi]|uniref:Uridine phosphorylase n=1 Tax=Demequina mangrovi TaxID=1043493 RepID=A0A1H6TVT1_9MICO|nr:purine-nucleoside phosphorylase [Demequina mangrovi]SEI84153.1 purine-nucleoside phosphorylase [Demequina mangrovi]